MTSKEARKVLETLEAELVQARRHKDALQLEIEATDRRIQQLRGGHGLGGEISSARRRVEECDQVEADEPLSKALILGTPYVIDKVTPKRIFLRKAGNKNAIEQYHRDGKPVAQWGFTIDNREEVVAWADAMGPKRG